VVRTQRVEAVEDRHGEMGHRPVMV